MKKHNFNAGPSILPAEVIKQTADAIIDFQGEGLSILEISHRAKYFQPVLDEAEALMKELLNIPDGYRVIFLAGGALMGVLSAGLRFGGVNLVDENWLANPMSEAVSIVAYTLLIVYLVKASMKIKK